MSTETMIAIITSCTSLLIALVSIIAAVVSSLQARRAAESLEKLKFQYSMTENTQSLRDANFQQEITALQKIIQSIQKLKDNLQIVLYDDALSPARIQEIVAECRSNLLSVYEEQLVHYTQKDKVIGHNAKNTAVTIERIVKHATRNDPFSGIQGEDLDQLIELRNQLTETQNLLRDSMFQKLYGRLGGTKEQYGE